MSEIRKKTILVVDDELIIAEVEAAVLRDYGYDVRTASSGAEAIDLVDRTPGIDLVLMDINLGPGMDGTEAAAIILSRHDIPLIFLSSHTERAIVEKTEGITSYGYIVKNSGDTVLVASLKMAFRLHESRRKEREKDAAIAERELRLRSISDNLSRAMIYQVMAPPGGGRVFTYLSDVVREFYGISPDEGMADSNHIYNRIHPDDLGHLVRAEEEALAREAVFTFEARMRDPRGGIRWSQFVSSPHRLPDGTVCWNGIEFDITDRKRMEEELAHTRALLEETFAQSPIPMALASVPDMVFRIVNRAAGDFLGIDPAHYVGRSLGDVGVVWQDLRPDGTPLPLEELPLPRALAGQATRNREIMVRRPDGGVRWELADGAPIYGKDGSQIAALLVFADITDRKRAEEALQKEYRRTGEILGAIPAGLFVYRFEEPDRLVLVAGNPESERLTGIRAADWIGREFNEIWPNARAQGLTDRYLAVARNGGNTELEDVWYRDERVDGAFRIRVFAIPGGRLGVAFENVTQVKRAEEEVRRLLEEKTVLLREVHHRIRNNIATIESAMNLQQHLAEDPAVRDALGDAMGRVRSMRVLYENLLDTGNYREVRAGEYLRGLVGAIGQLFPDHGAIAIEPAIGDFTLDSKRMSSLGIIVNELITNAYKHAFIGRARGRISLAVEKREDRVALEIRDDGAGIAGERLVAGAEGFGLTIVRALARQLGGDLVIEGGAGTTCRLSFTA